MVDQGAQTPGMSEGRVADKINSLVPSMITAQVPDMIDGGITGQVPPMISAAIGAIPAVAVPGASSTTPKANAATAVVGLENAFARGDHIHPGTLVRRQTVTMGSAAASYTWTYPAAFPTGTVPTISAIVQVAALSNDDVFSCHIVGTPSNTSCVIQIKRVSPGLLALLLGALSVNNTPTAATLHLVAVA